MLNSKLRFFRQWKFSNYAIVLTALILLFRIFYVAEYKSPKYVWGGDVMHYYAYLPALLVYHDLRLDFVKENPSAFKHTFWPVTAPNGNLVIMTTMGTAIMYAPFVVPCHYFLKLTGQEAMGFSFPYKLALVLSSLFYTILGFILIRKMLKAYFSDVAVGLTLLCTMFATNFIYYATREASFSHAYSFFLITWLAYNTSNYYKKPGIAKAVLIGISAGLIALVRPTNMVALILIPLWNIGSVNDIKNRISMLVHRWKEVLVLFLAFLLVITPQIVYWKMTSGQFFFNGYGEGGRFFFGNPQFANILLSYRKGWLVYTPVMVVALLGFIPLYRNQRQLFVPVLSYVLINIYVLASWWLWWYGGSYGNRGFIDMYGLLTFPMAAVFHYFLIQRKWWVRMVSFVIALLFIGHNTFQVIQYFNGAIHYVSMTKEAYWDSFGRLKPSDKYKDLLVFPDYEAAKEGRYPKPVVESKKGQE